MSRHSIRSISRSAISHIAGLAQGAVSIAFPPNCALCGAGVPSHKHALCPRCTADTEYGSDAFCLRCGAIKQSGTGVSKICIVCERPGVMFAMQGVSAAGEFEGSLRECILRLKFSGERGLAKPLAAWMYLALSHRDWKPHLIVPVPLGSTRMWERGFNQAEEIANELSKLTGLPCHPHAVRRKRNTSPQTQLESAVERRTNMKGAFSPDYDAGAIRNKRVLLVDDVSTTGATLSAVARVLNDLGAKSVHGLLAARTPFQPGPGIEPDPRRTPWFQQRK